MADDEQWGKAEDWGSGPAQDDWTVDSAPDAEQPTTEVVKTEGTAQAEATQAAGDKIKMKPSAKKVKERGKEKQKEKQKERQQETNKENGTTGAEHETEGKEMDKEREREKVEPYVNPDRVATGGQQRTKLSADELADRMEKIRLKNAQIKERREKIEADKHAFSKLMEQDNARAKRQAQLQATVDSTRDENARIKLERQANRAWDAEKKVQKERFYPRGRGGKRGRGRGRGGGGGGEDSSPGHAFQEDALVAVVTGEEGTTEEHWGAADDWGTAPAQDDWSKGSAEGAEKSDMPADDEWAQGNTEDWA